MIKLLKTVCLCVVTVIVFGCALCSKATFLLLITLSNEGTKTLAAEQKPVALLCIGCSLIAPSVILLQKSLWKACYKSAKMPARRTVALVRTSNDESRLALRAAGTESLLLLLLQVLFFEFIVSAGAAILTVVAMPHLDIVTNVTILNGAAILSSLLQVVSQCYAKERNRFLLPSLAAFFLILLGYGLFLYLYVTKDLTDTKTFIWAGLAVGGSILVSFNWWESYFRLISENSGSVALRAFCRDVKQSQNMLNIISSLLRIAVTAAVVGAYVPLAQMDWNAVTSIPQRETRIIGIIIGVQLISSVLCHWFAVAACKMHALRRCFVLPLHLASLGVLVLYVVPIIVYYQDYRTSLNGTSVDFTGYCSQVVDGRNSSWTGSVFPQLVLDATHTLCFLDMSKIADIGILTGSATSWWLGLVLATAHLWKLSLYRIERTQDLFIRRLYDGAFIEQSLLLNTRYDIQTTQKRKSLRPLEPVKVFLCATMWHETRAEMMRIIISIFRMDRFQPKSEKEVKDMTFEGNIYFDDAFKDVPGSQGRHVNEYAEALIETIQEVYSIFLNMDKDLFQKQQQIPDQTLVRTPYGGRVVLTMPHGNSLTVHFKDKKLVRHKKRWSQVMYMYHLLGWKLSTKFYQRWGGPDSGEDQAQLIREFQKEKNNTYILTLDGDTDFQPSSVMLLIDRLRLYPKVGAACGRIHPTGSGPMVWYQKFEYALGHWLTKAAEHVLGCVMCSPGCFSLFRASALMDDNVMKKYTTRATRPLHHIQYNLGEDRWLCTLMLKQGWRVEYNAASDAYTNAPEEFKEFYNQKLHFLKRSTSCRWQRRRWSPSTFANSVDLLDSGSLILKRNSSMSRPFLFYQLCSMFSSILAPSTVILMIAGSFTLVFDVNPNVALILATLPPAIFLAVSFKLKADTQITIAAVMSVLYGFLMVVTTITTISGMVRQNTIMTPSGLFIFTISGFYLIAAIMHPQEIALVFYGLLYVLCIPSTYMLLMIYALVNMNNMSWGTRETAPAADATGAEAAASQSHAQKAKNIFVEFFTRAKCCRKVFQRERLEEAQETSHMVHTAPPEPQPQNTIVEDVQSPEEQQEQQEEQRQEAPAVTCSNQCWITQLQSLSDDVRLSEDSLDQEEEQFFTELIDRYLQPVQLSQTEQQHIADELQQLRNKLCFTYFTCNAFWLAITFTLEVMGMSVFTLPKLDVNLQYTGEDISVDPMAFMFILAFAVLVLVQLLAMIYHRVSTLLQFVAYQNTVNQNQEPTQAQEPQYTTGPNMFTSTLLDPTCLLVHYWTQHGPNVFTSKLLDPTCLLVNYWTQHGPNVFTSKLLDPTCLLLVAASVSTVQLCFPASRQTSKPSDPTPRNAAVAVMSAGPSRKPVGPVSKHSHRSSSSSSSAAAAAAAGEHQELHPEAVEHPASHSVRFTSSQTAAFCHKKQQEDAEFKSGDRGASSPLSTLLHGARCW
ncbi:uncharacterized protein V6R79_005913 [Siganus canaliculatus]